MRRHDDWEDKIRDQLLESAEVKRRAARVCCPAIQRAAEIIADCLRSGGKLLVCGNGGSAADAQHIAAELVGRLRPGSERPPLAAIALTTDTSALTALANDYGYEMVFQRQVEALGRQGDVLLAISTSGRSQNVLRAVAAAASRGMTSVGLSGGAGLLAAVVDVEVVVPSEDGQRIQEAHIAIGHIICGLVESLLSTEAKEQPAWVTGSVT
ncbi:MAG: SIS domain-containing protein [Dehalococcoidia bacterium]